MLHFHLTRYWFDQYKNGFKSIEYRVATPREENLLNNQFALVKFGDHISCRLYCGYPRKGDLDRILDGFVRGVRFVRLCDLPQAEKRFFLNKTDSVFCINDNTLFFAYELEF